MNEETRVIQLYKDMFTAMTEKDVDALEAVLDPSFAVTHPTTTTQDRKSFIGDITSGKLVFHTAEHKDFNLRVIGNNAWLIARTDTDAQLYGTDRKVWELQLKLSLRCTDGQWRFTDGRILVC